MRQIAARQIVAHGAVAFGVQPRVCAACLEA